MHIGELAHRTGVAAHLLRYYEQQNLLHPQRQSNGYRIYPEHAVERVRQIRGLLEAGLSTQLIGQILPCVRGPEPHIYACGVVDQQLEAALEEELDRIDDQIVYLTSNRRAIRAFLEQMKTPPTTVD
ncbi:MerR family transcriptional regulator [Nocardia brasiliensis]|uniref:MerR family transcriptional regulator n=1 Tax=Nocardia brasiliensis TaxID=37326 RepID=A0A6G9Y375_NOCBR|nr:MerR family transcriptional regulator [Nocardia brasiliensis]